MSPKVRRHNYFTRGAVAEINFKGNVWRYVYYHIITGKIHSYFKGQNNE